MARPARPPARAALGALLAALALAALFPPAGGQQALPQADLAVLEVLPGQPAVNATANLTALVRNEGPADARLFRVAFGWGSAATELANGSALQWPEQAANFTDAQPAGCLTFDTGLARGCTVRATYGWTPAAGSREGPGTIVGTAEVRAGHADPFPANNSASNATFVARHHLALVLDPADDRSKQVPPGHTAFYRLTVRNLGNVAELAQLAIASAAWGGGAQLTQANATLAPGGEARFLALLAMPPGAPATAAATVTANASAAPALGAASRTLPLTHAVQGLAADYALEPLHVPPVVLAPGAAREVVVQVRNLGGAEDAVRWSLAAPAPAGWDVSFPAAWTGVQGPTGALANATVRVQASPGLPGGALAAVQALGTPRNGAQPVTVNLTLRTPAPDLVVENLTLGAPAVYQGETVDVRLDVRNTGPAALPKPARVLVRAERAGEAPSVVGDLLLASLDPGESRSLLFPWATAGLRGAYDLVAAVDPDGDVAEMDDANNARSLALVVRVGRLEAGAPANRTVQPGETASFQGAAAPVVRNLGDAPESVEVAVRTPQGWVQRTERVALLPGEARALPLEVPVPVRPGTNAEALVVEAWLVNRTTVRAEARATLTVEDRAPPELQRLEAPDFVELGTPGRFEAHLVDAVGVRSADLVLRMPDGSLRTEPMRDAGQDRWVASVVMGQPGAVAHWVRAVDATPRNNTLDTGSAQGLTLVGVRSAPLVELVEPRPGSAVRPGTLLKFRITDIHGVAQVVARDGPREFELQAPYVLPTTGWEEGLHSLEVVARNRFGNGATQRFDVTVDATPPEVHDVVLSPPRPSPGEVVHVEARATRDARIAVVQLLRAGAVLREVPAELGLGLITANLTVPEPGRYVLAVRVEDEAGNAASRDVPLDIGQGVPGPGSTAVLGSLVATALAAARRRLK